MQYNEVVQKAIEFIEIHLKDEISLYDVAQYVNFSVPHLYRIFKAFTGETIKSYIMKRRLSCAASELKQTHKNISEIAYEYGFESHDVFTRAFFRTYHMSPKQYRRSDTVIGCDITFEYRDKGIFERSNIMKYKIINMNQITIIGMECRAKQWDADGEIGRLWSRFLENVDQVKKSLVPNVMYGICECKPSDSGDTFTYIAGIEVNQECNIPEGMVKKIIREQKFLQAEVPEDVKTPDAYTRATEYAKENGYLIDEYDELEVYEEVFKDPDDHAFKLLIPIK